MNRPLRTLFLLGGLLPAFALMGVVAYGFIGPNDWTVTAAVDVDVLPQDVIPLTGDVRKWRDWLLVDQRSDVSFETVQTAQVTGAGATLEWNTGFVTGGILLINEWEDATSYALDFRERRAGRPRQTQTNPNAEPTSWTQSEGSLVVETKGDGVRLTLGLRGTAGPRPLGPFLLAGVQQKHQDESERRVLALGERAQALAERRRLIGP